jgi:hypothetical protein
MNFIQKKFFTYAFLCGTVVREFIPAHYTIGFG